MARRADSPDASRDVVAGIRISHPDRLIYPELRIPKIALARYYEDIGRWILPHVKGRPLTLVHCPAGVAEPCRYLRHAKAWGPNALRRVRIQEKTKVGEYLVAGSIAAVVALAQMGIVEIHTWNSLADDVERPNRLVWDLDHGPRVGWSEIVAAARLLRELLGTLGLAAWVKTTGGRGLHVVAPICAYSPRAREGARVSRCRSTGKKSAAGRTAGPCSRRRIACAGNARIHGRTTGAPSSGSRRRAGARCGACDSAAGFDRKPRSVAPPSPPA
ncbi:MAG TPA: hypothetical protein VFO19_19040 [Vicinamibacterales bacterium]|nr:hypothetical protein [Vicinamibacterales bacterium]